MWKSLPTITGIVGALVGVISAIFAAGVYYQTAKTQLTDYMHKTDSNTNAIHYLEHINIVPSGATSTSGSPEWGGASIKRYPLICANGQVAIGVELSVGGSCNRACEPDGLPVHQFKVICQSLHVAK
jgi:hypothetical protein